MIRNNLQAARGKYLILLMVLLSLVIPVWAQTQGEDREPSQDVTRSGDRFRSLTAATQRTGRRLPSIAPATLEILEAYTWPGNVVEMRQVASEMLSSAVLTSTIQPSHLPLQIRTFGGTLIGGKQPAVEPISLDEVLLDLERIMLQRALKLSPRNRARAARMLGISRPRFLRRISQLGLDDQPSPEEE